MKVAREALAAGWAGGMGRAMSRPGTRVQNGRDTPSLGS